MPYRSTATVTAWPNVPDGHVEVDVDDRIAEIRCERLTFGIEDVADNDVCPLGNHRPSMALAHPTGAAGNQCDLPGESVSDDAYAVPPMGCTWPVVSLCQGLTRTKVNTKLTSGQIQQPEGPGP